MRKTNQSYRAIRWQCLPPHECINTKRYYYFWKNCFYFKKWFQNMKKSFPLVCRAFRDKIIYVQQYNTLHFDQYSRLSICLNIFEFSVNNTKNNLKFEKKIVCRDHRDESIDVQQRFRIRTKDSYSFKGTYPIFWKLFYLWTDSNKICTVYV